MIEPLCYKPEVKAARAATDYETVPRPISKVKIFENRGTDEDEDIDFEMLDAAKDDIAEPVSPKDDSTSQPNMMQLPAVMNRELVTKSVPGDEGRKSPLRPIAMENPHLKPFEEAFPDNANDSQLDDDEFQDIIQALRERREAAKRRAGVLHDDQATHPVTEALKLNAKQAMTPAPLEQTRRKIRGGFDELRQRRKQVHADGAKPID